MKGFTYPGEQKKYNVKDSNIEGKGVFASKNIESGELVGTMISNSGEDPRLEGEWEDLARKINHQKDNNSLMRRDGDDYNLYTKENISKGEELTMDYKDTPWWVDKNIKGFKDA